LFLRQPGLAKDLVSNKYGFQLPIPDGYRNLTELIDQDRAMRIQDLVPVDASVVISEQGPPEALWIAIRGFPADLALATEADCRKLAAESAHSSGLPPAVGVLETTPLGPACTFELHHPAEHDEAIGDAPAYDARETWLLHAGKMLLLVCGGTDSTTRDRVCRQFRDGATAEP